MLALFLYNLILELVNSSAPLRSEPHNQLRQM